MKTTIRTMLALAVLVTFPASGAHGQEVRANRAATSPVEQELAGMTTIDQIDELAAAWFSQGRVDDSIAAFEHAKTRFPEDLYTTIRRLVFFYVHTKQFDKVMDNWELGQAKGLFFPAESRAYEPLFQTERYRTFLAANRKLLAQARENATAQYDVVLPEGFDPAAESPVFIVLHGNNLNTAVMKSQWKLDKDAGRMIVVFLQSSQITGSDSFIWDDIVAGRRDVADCWAWLQKKYMIDRQRVLIGGFSGGGGMAIDAAVRGVVPARAFIALCPGGVLPGRSDLAALQEAAGRNLVGQIIAGERDDPEEAKALVALLAEAGLRVGLTIVPGLGHGFPDDITVRLGGAVRAVLE